MRLAGPIFLNGQVTVKDMEPDNLSMAAAQELVYEKKKEEASNSG